MNVFILEAVSNNLERVIKLLKIIWYINVGKFAEGSAQS